MENWHWFLVGAVGGYLLAKQGGGGGLSFGFSAGANGAGAGDDPGSRRGWMADGGGTTPLGQPRGSDPYTAQTAYRADGIASFPVYTDPDAPNRIVTGGPVQ